MYIFKYLILYIIYFLSTKNFSKYFHISIIFTITVVIMLNVFSVSYGLICYHSWKKWMIVLTCVSYVISIGISQDHRLDIYLLKGLILVGSVGIIISNHLILTYICLELQTFSLFILINKDKYSIKSAESSLKYFILGALSSGFVLISLTSIYNMTGLLNITELSLVLQGNQYLWNWLLILVLSILFKLGLFPLHFWIPDIYEGSSIEILSLLNTLPKISIISLFIDLNVSNSLVIYTGLLSIVIGALAGVNQTKVKRLLGYSGISHLGFIIFTLSIQTWFSLELALLYLTLYIVSILGVLILMNNTLFSKDLYIIELGGLIYSFPVITVAWSLLFLSIAGLPPLTGFLIKWWVVWEAISNNYLIVGFIMVLVSSISIAYYLRISKILFFQNKSSYFNWESIFYKPETNFTMLYLVNFILYINLFVILNPSLIINLVYGILYV